MDSCRNNYLPERKGEAAFTLLELLIALSIMTLLISLTFSGFQIAGRAWEKGEIVANKQQRLRIIPDLIRKQVSALILVSGKGQEDNSFLFRGSSDELFFYSNHSLYPNNKSGAVLVHYKIEKKDGEYALSFYERKSMGIDEIDFVEIETSSHVNLLHECSDISFSFLQLLDEESREREWVSSWDRDEKDGLPLAVRFSMRKDKTDEKVNVIIPVFVSLADVQ